MSDGCEGDIDSDGVIDSADQCPASPANVMVTENGCEVDADNDGVADSLDQCQYTATGFVVGADGCELDSDQDGVVDSVDQCISALLVVVDAKGCEVDTDKDGLIDSRDACPESPEGVEVDERGCEVLPDIDTDGVADIYDLCSDTASGTQADDLGCDPLEKRIITDIRFKFDSNELTYQSSIMLSELAERMRYREELKLEVAGHTDDMGDPDANLILSTKRAEAVKDYLVEHGVNEANLTVRGYGDQLPITSNETSAKRSINRRVELIRK